MSFDVVKSKQLYDLAWEEETDEAAAVELIKDPNVNVNYSPEDQDGRTPLRMAAWNGHIKITKALLAHPDINVNQTRMSDDATPLYVACQEGHTKVVKLLLARPDIDVNQPDSADGITPIYMASSSGHASIIKFLLAMRQEIDVLAKPKPGAVNEIWRLQTPAQQAKAQGHTQIFELLKLYEPSDDLIETKNRQAKIRKALRKDLNIHVEDAAKLLAFVVLLSDEYLQFKSEEDQHQKVFRLFRISLKLPLELQTRICNLAFEYDSILMPSESFEAGLKAALKLLM